MKRRALARGLVITPLGHEVLRLAALGQYKFAPAKGGYGASRKGKRQKKK